MATAFHLLITDRTAAFPARLPNIMRRVRAAGRRPYT
jgi:hypothetical protein